MIKINENTGKETEVTKTMEMRVELPQSIFENAPKYVEGDDEGKKVAKEYYESLTFDDVVEDGKVKVSFTEQLSSKDYRDGVIADKFYVNYETPEDIKPFFDSIKTVLILPTTYIVREGVKGFTFVKAGE